MGIMDPSQTLDDALEAIFDDDDPDTARPLIVELMIHLHEGGENPVWNQSRCEKMLDCLNQLLQDLD